MICGPGGSAHCWMGAKAIGADYCEPGLTFSPDLVSWFDAMQIPCLVTDTLANETTYEPQTGVMLPLHGALMRTLGVVFTEAARSSTIFPPIAPRDRRFEAFLFCASPIKVVGGIRRRFDQSARAEMSLFPIKERTNSNDNAG